MEKKKASSQGNLSSNSPFTEDLLPLKSHTMIITYLGNSVNEYMNDFLPKLNITKFSCPYCDNQHLVSHDSYRRRLRCDEDIYWFDIARVLCNRCGKTHAILPDFIAPYRHFDAPHINKTIEMVIEGKATIDTASGSQESSTTKRWVQRFLGDWTDISGMLQSILIELKKEYLSLLNSPTIWQAFLATLDAFPPTNDTSSIGQANKWLLNFQTQIWI